MGSNAGGFKFDNCKRNGMLEAKGVQAPIAWKTGTTIAGVVYKVRALQPVLLSRMYKPVHTLCHRPLKQQCLMCIFVGSMVGARLFVPVPACCGSGMSSLQLWHSTWLWLHLMVECNRLACRMVSCLVQTPARRPDLQWLTKIVKRSTTSHPTSTAVVPAQQQTLRT